MGNEVSAMLQQNKNAASIVLYACSLGNFKNDVLREFLGMIVLVGTQFPAGLWFGTQSWVHGWIAHGLGVIIADWVAGGPNVNPAVCIFMHALGEITFSQMISRSAAAFAGAMVAFPLFQTVGRILGLPMFGGPRFDHREASLARVYQHEATATGLLCLAVVLLNWELAIKDNYLVKQALTAVAVRLLLLCFTAGGCAMNPALGVAYGAHERGGRLPKARQQYTAYCTAPAGGALGAALLYALSSGRKFYGVDLRALIGIGVGSAARVRADL
eukprot:m.48054 g.48054  ORF g.48054 m.48054 type:complete len:272 (-) comp15250_c0_seq1:268-1083(-)